MRRPFPTPILAAVLMAASASADVPAAKGKYTVGGLRSGSSTSSGSRSDSSFAATMNATVREGRVTGHLRAAFKGEDSIDLTLALPITEPPAGTALPADGGEPGKALRACNGAFASRKLADLQRLCAPGTVDYIESAVRMKEQGVSQEDPWRRAAAGECEVSAVASLTIESGVAAGDEARIRASGGWDDERKCAGDVFLRRENGKWRVATSRLALTP